MLRMLPISVSTRGGHGDRHAVVNSKDPRAIESSKTELYKSLNRSIEVYLHQYCVFGLIAIIVKVIAPSGLAIVDRIVEM